MSDDIILKILLLGDMTVGKTTLLLKYVDNFLPDTYISTMGVDYKMKKIEYKNIEVTLQIWDTAGQERYRALTKSYLKGSDGILFLYDITKKESFERIKNYWYKEFKEECGDIKGKKIYLIIFSNWNFWK